VATVLGLVLILAGSWLGGGGRFARRRIAGEAELAAKS
jgi:hypothetical protein